MKKDCRKLVDALEVVNPKTTTPTAQDILDWLDEETKQNNRRTR